MLLLISLLKNDSEKLEPEYNSTRVLIFVSILGIISSIIPISILTWLAFQNVVFVMLDMFLFVLGTIIGIVGGNDATNNAEDEYSNVTLRGLIGDAMLIGVFFGVFLYFFDLGYAIVKIVDIIGDKVDQWCRRKPSNKQKLSQLSNRGET